MSADGYSQNITLPDTVPGAGNITSNTYSGFPSKAYLVMGKTERERENYNNLA